MQALLLFALRLGFLGVVTYIGIDTLGALTQWWPENAVTGWIIHAMENVVVVSMVAGTSFLMMFGMAQQSAHGMTAILFMALSLAGLVYITVRDLRKKMRGGAASTILATGAALMIVLLSVWMFGAGANHPGLWVGAIFASAAVAAGITVWRTDRKQ